MPNLEQIKAVIRNEKGAWMRFLLALLGLAAAFAAAVLSTVERIAGNVIGTAILASISLLLAGTVGLLTVPYLTRRVVRSRVRDAFDYDLTREGLVYLGFTLVIGVAALNTGNNLLFIIVSAMLGAVIVSGVASAVLLRSLELDIMLPAHVFARSAATGRIKLRNLSRLAPVFSVSVVAPSTTRRRKLLYEKTTYAFPSRNPSFHLPDVTIRLATQDNLSSPSILREPVYFPYVPAGTTANAEVDLNFSRRGLYSQESFGLATRFPFSLFVKTRRVRIPRELIVYPSIEATDDTLEILPMIRGEFESFVRGRGYDLYRIREHVPEDSARHVDWKATAKTGQLKVREFTREDERKLRIVFDNPSPGLIPESEYERAVGTAASLAWHFAAEDIQLSFVAPNYAGSPDVHEFLRYLAMVQPAPADSVLDTLQSGPDYNLIITARQRGSVPTSLWSTSYVLFVNGSH